MDHETTLFVSAYSAATPKSPLNVGTKINKFHSISNVPVPTKLTSRSHDKVIRYKRHLKSVGWISVANAVSTLDEGEALVELWNRFALGSNGLIEDFGSNGNTTLARLYWGEPGTRASRLHHFFRELAFDERDLKGLMVEPQRELVAVYKDVNILFSEVLDDAALSRMDEENSDESSTYVPISQKEKMAFVKLLDFIISRIWRAKEALRMSLNVERAEAAIRLPGGDIYAKHHPLLYVFLVNFQRELGFVNVDRRPPALFSLNGFHSGLMNNLLKQRFNYRVLVNVDGDEEDDEDSLWGFGRSDVDGYESSSTYENKMNGDEFDDDDDDSWHSTSKPVIVEDLWGSSKYRSEIRTEYKQREAKLLILENLNNRSILMFAATYDLPEIMRAICQTSEEIVAEADPDNKLRAYGTYLVLLALVRNSKQCLDILLNEKGFNSSCYDGAFLAAAVYFVAPTKDLDANTQSEFTVDPSLLEGFKKDLDPNDDKQYLQALKLVMPNVWPGKLVSFRLILSKLSGRLSREIYEDYKKMLKHQPAAYMQALNERKPGVMYGM